MTRHADGIELFLPWRKNDQDARGTKLWLPQGRTDLCPVTALEAWLAAAAISDGPAVPADLAPAAAACSGGAQGGSR